MNAPEDEAKVLDLYRLALRIARCLTRDITAAMDLAGEATVVALEDRRILAESTAYQGTVVRNVFRRRGKRDSLRQGKEAAHVADAEVEQPLDAELRAERARLLLDELMALPKKLREVFLRRADLGQSYREISEELGAPISTVEGRYQRAVARLRHQLQNRLGSNAAIVAWLAPLATAVPPRPPLGWRRVAVVGMAGACLVMATLWGVSWRTAPAPAPVAAAPRTTPPSVADVRDAVVRQQVTRTVNASTSTAAPATATIRGRMLDVGGSPAADRRVLLIGYDALHLGIAGEPFGAPVPPPLTTATTRTDQAGQFELSGIAPRTHQMLVLDPGGAHRTLRPVDLTLSAGEATDVGDLYLVARGVVTGRVVDEEQLPVRGATVWAADVPGAAGLMPLGAVSRVTHGLFRDRVSRVPPWLRELPTWLGIPFTRTDDEGRFVLDGVAPGPNVLVTTADGRLDDVRAVVVSSGRRLAVGDVGLDDEAGDTEVIVRTEVGVGIEHAEVIAGPDWSLPILGPDRMLQPLAAQSPTGKDGRTRLHGIGEAGFVVAARRGPDAPWHVVRTGRGSRRVIVTLPEERPIRLRLVDEDDRPITEAQFALVAGDEERVQLALGLAVARSLALSVGDDGTWAGVAEVGAGDELVVRADGRRTLVVPARELGAPETRTMAFVRPVALRVRTPAGLAVAGAEVYLRAADGAAESRQLLQGLADHWTSPPRFLGCTDGDGELVGGVDLDGPAWLVVVAPAHSPWARSVKPSPAPIEVELVPPSRLRAEVVQTGAASTRDLRVVVSADWREPSGMPVEQWLRQLDPEGRFGVDDLVAERAYMIGIRRGLRELTSLGDMVRRAVSTDNVFKARHRCTIPAGSCHMSFDLTPLQHGERTAAVTVTGTLTIDGRVADGCTLRLLAETDLWNSLRDGLDLPLTSARFSFTGVAQLPTYALELHGADAGECLWRRPLRRGDGLDLQVDHDLVLTTLAGSCGDADGAALAFVDLVLHGTLGPGPSGAPDTARVEVRTTAAGELRTRLVPGTYVLEGANARSEPFVVAVPWSAISARLVASGAERCWLVSAR